ncbi:MAG: penicillin-binding protein [Erysipelotrichales bacterium]|nr:penicillin-binding protein [Erysipelotrichales bacterium]
MKYTNNTIRINLIFIFSIVLLFGLFFVKLAYVALNTEVEGTDLALLAKNRSIATRTIRAERGRIYDNAGELLAQNVNSYKLIAYLNETRTTDERYPKHVVDKEYTARMLADVLTKNNVEVTEGYIYTLLNQTGLYQTEFGVAGKGLTENIKRQIEALDLPGIDFIKTSKRYYQNGNFASYIVGYAKTYENEDGSETIGELGIEGYCNRYLKGKDGTITYQKDAYGYQMAGDDKITYVEEALDGYDVYLTLDKQVQIFLDNTVEELKKFNPEWITLTVANAKTGAIIGSSTSPSFNPNTLNIENYNNPLISFTYEPGSTMKIFSFMSAIEDPDGKYNGAELYKSGTIEVADYKIKDWNTYGWGNIPFDVGFTYSSNVAAVRLAQRLGRKKLMNYYSSLGFGKKTGIELSNELAGDISFDYDVEVASASYGQGVTITPIQMIQALTTLTNDGTVLKPYIIDKIVDPNTGKTVYTGKRTELNKVYSTSTVNKMIELMDNTVNSTDPVATGKSYSTDAVRLIGKTGTANYVGPGGKYVTGTYNNIRSFAGVFPKESPEYIIYIATKDFQGATASIAKEIKALVESVAKYRNLDERPSDKDETKIVTVGNYLNNSVISSQTKIINTGVTPVVIGNGDVVIDQYPKKNTKISQKAKVFLITNGSEITMPDMTGWSSSEVTSFAKLTNIPISINGYGYVQSTNIIPGAIIDTSSTLIVELVNIDAGSLVSEVEE